MYHRGCGLRLAVVVAAGLSLAGCESLPEGAIGDIGRSVFGDVAGVAAATASVQMIQDTADSMCSAGNAMCRNVTVVAMSGFTKSFIDQITQSDVREINDARARSIATGEDQSWKNDETGASGQVSSKPAEPLPPQPTAVKVKKDSLESLPLMDAVGEPYVVRATGGAKVRGGPGTGFSVVETLKGEEKIQAIGKVRDDDWYLVGRGSVGLGYVFGELIQRWVAPQDEPLDQALAVTDTAVALADPEVTEVEVEMASECFTTTQTVTLANGTSENATVTSCRTPDGWAQV